MARGLAVVQALSLGFDLYNWYQSKVDEGKNGFFFDPMKGKTVVTDIDKAAKTLPVGTKGELDGEEYTLGEDGKWRDKDGNYLIKGTDGTVFSSKNMA
jgi:hypothetical protein